MLINNFKGSNMLLAYVGIPIATLYAIMKLCNRARYNFQGKVVMITGASSGLGEALAHEFYAKGCKVVLSARREDELNRVKQDLLNKKIPNVQTYTPLVVPLDLANVNSLPAAVETVLRNFEHIDVLINNGGISHRGKILQTNIDVDVKLMGVNYLGPIALTKAVLPSMVERRSGHIVFVSSVQGLIAIPHRSAYGAAKHAMQAFTDSLRAEMNEYDIDVSIVSPGYIKTNISLNALTADGDKHGVMDPSIAAGFEPEYVAKKIVSMVAKKEKELVVSQLTPKFGIHVRYWIPSLYFNIMAKRATKSISI